MKANESVRTVRAVALLAQLDGPAGLGEALCERFLSRGLPPLYFQALAVGLLKSNQLAVRRSQHQEIFYFKIGRLAQLLPVLGRKWELPAEGRIDAFFYELNHL